MSINKKSHSTIYTKPVYDKYVFKQFKHCVQWAGDGKCKV